jgi:hypothetical protein
MSYDLYFYKKKENSLTEQEIADYLTAHLTSERENDKQWYVKNDAPEAYFFIEHNEAETEEDDTDFFIFKGYENTNFSFSLNYCRANFFGQFAFEFVDKFVNDLELYVLDPQLGSDNPIKPKEKEFYENWSLLNVEICKHFHKEKIVNAKKYIGVRTALFVFLIIILLKIFIKLFFGEP